MIGADIPRVDARAKVTGDAKYGADVQVDNPAFAYLVTAAIARGRITRIDDAMARSREGVLEIYTHENVGTNVSGGKPMTKLGYMGSGVAPLGSDKIHYADSIVAIVIAESFEIARDAALAMVIEYEAEQPTATLHSEGEKLVKAKALGETEIDVGKFLPAFKAAAVKVDVRYQTPAQHHNPMELFQTTAVWSGEKLTVYESSQNVVGYQHGLAKQLSVAVDDIRVVSKFVGGAFGSRGELGQSTALIAYAAKQLGRPVKLVASRPQGFSLRTFRAETEQRVSIGADEDGKIQAIAHEGWELCSRDDHFAVAGIESTLRIYGSPNICGRVHNVEADRQVSGFMRAPPEVPYMFALESAIDELAVALKLDPIELRRRNDIEREPVKNLPFSSRGLMRCFDAAALAFGWEKRTAEPRSMREDEWLIGYGAASAIYPTQIAPASARVTLTREGKVFVETSASDIGTGSYTIFAQIAAEALGVPSEIVTVRLADSDLPATPLTAGSNTTASVGSAIDKTARALRERIVKAAVAAKGTALGGAAPGSIALRGNALWSGALSEPIATIIERIGENGVLAEEDWHIPDGSPPALIGKAAIETGRALIVAGVKHKHHVQFAFGAHLVEVRVHAATHEIRVPRMVGAFAGGRVINPRTARSQLMGAQIWGLGSALLEETEIDRRTARYVNADLGEYHVAVNADVGEVQTLMIEEKDRKVNPIGAKGLGELGLVGMNAAIANAIFHATGTRIRRLPIRVQSLLDAEKGTR